MTHETERAFSDQLVVARNACLRTRKRPSVDADQGRITAA
jgi:hypothetical protein